MLVVSSFVLHVSLLRSCHVVSVLRGRLRVCVVVPLRVVDVILRFPVRDDVVVYLGLVQVVVIWALTSHGASMILCLQSSLEVLLLVVLLGLLPLASVLVLVVVMRQVVE